jgi:ubiquinone/menaquinone biosynthesis C-methylase UbiE
MGEPSKKQDVQNYWEQGACGEVYVIDDVAQQTTARYALEPYIFDFARFEEGAGKDVLEVGVGMGADHAEWAKHVPHTLAGVDLTERALEWTRQRLQSLGYVPDVQQGDAEALPFKEASFDLVYSWGVIHHSPDTLKAVAEIHRVLRFGGVARVMIYHTWSLTGLMLWGRYALLAGKPWRTLADVYAHHLESPHTKAYTKGTARKMFEHAGFKSVTVKVQLNHGDLLQGEVGQRHRGRLLSAAKALWPRWLFRTVTPFLGLYLLIEARK